MQGKSFQQDYLSIMQVISLMKWVAKLLKIVITMKQPIWILMRITALRKI